MKIVRLTSEPVIERNVEGVDILPTNYSMTVQDEAENEYEVEITKNTYDTLNNLNHMISMSATSELEN